MRFLEPGEGAPGSVGLSAEWTLLPLATRPGGSPAACACAMRAAVAAVACSRSVVVVGAPPRNCTRPVQLGLRFSAAPKVTRHREPQTCTMRVLLFVAALLGGCVAHIASEWPAQPVGARTLQVEAEQLLSGAHRSLEGDVQAAPSPLHALRRPGSAPRARPALAPNRTPVWEGEDCAARLHL